MSLPKESSTHLIMVSSEVACSTAESSGRLGGGGTDSGSELSSPLAFDKSSETCWVKTDL